MHTRSFAAFFALTLLVVGCDGDPDTPDAGPTADDAGMVDGGAPPGDAGPDAGVTGDDAGATADAGPPAEGLDGFEDTVATAWCAALFRCCDAADLEAAFDPYRAIPGLPSQFEAFQDRLPPEATLTEASCGDLMRDLNEVAPFGQWLIEARAGRVGFDEDAYDACLADLAGASCGRELSLALNDTQCFALRDNLATAPTPGGTVNRAFFERTAVVDDPCTALEQDDAIYGTCDPSAAFCCARATPGEDCMRPEVGVPGTCVAVSAEDGDCADFPPQPCAEGLVCEPGESISDPGTCAPAPTATADNGETCAEAFVTTATCADGFCDTSTDPALCAARKGDGESCNVDDECASFNCDGDVGAQTCQPFSFCTEAS